MEGRKFESKEYRFGFNGKEKDGDAASEHYDFGARLYNPTLGRWLTVDPSASKYPGISPYNFVLNSPARPQMICARNLSGISECL